MATDIIARGMSGKALGKLSTLGTALTYKGAVDTYDNLPENPSNGDVYVTQDDGKSYAYGEDGWSELGSDIDMSAYLLKSELASATGNSTTTTMTQAAITSNFNKVYIQETQPAHANEGDVWINPVPDGSALPSFENEEF